MYQWVSWNFPLYYAVAFGKRETFDIEVKKYKSQEIKSFLIEARSMVKMKDKKNAFNTVERPKPFLYKTISDSIGYLSVPNFYGHEDFEEFYLKSFKSIKNDKIKHLIIDIQDNVGGEEGNENLLASYLLQEPFKKYKNVLASKEAYGNFKNKKSVILDAWTLKDGVPHRGEFTLMSNYFSDLGYKQPHTDLIFSGKVYVLTSGVTFSGGAEFASMLKMKNRATFIGEETGGTYEGNVSGYSRGIKLANTKIKVSIPIVHFKINVSPEIQGRGILPDHVVYQTWDDIVQGTNSKLEFAVNLIKN
jgi:C-terminal processing protease CtpA/Prc